MDSIKNVEAIFFFCLFVYTGNALALVLEKFLKCVVSQIRRHHAFPHFTPDGIFIVKSRAPKKSFFAEPVLLGRFRIFEISPVSNLGVKYFNNYRGSL